MPVFPTHPTGSIRNIQICNALYQRKSARTLQPMQAFTILGLQRLSLGHSKPFFCNTYNPFLYTSTPNCHILQDTSSYYPSWNSYWIYFFTFKILRSTLLIYEKQRYIGREFYLNESGELIQYPTKPLPPR